MSDRENRRAEAEARRAVSARPDSPPERDELMLRYLGAETYATRTGRPAQTPGSRPRMPRTSPHLPPTAESRGGHRRVGCARSALAFALDEACRRGADLNVVCAFSAPDYWATAYGMPAPPPLDELTCDIERAGRQMVDEAVSERDVMPPRCRSRFWRSSERQERSWSSKMPTCWSWGIAGRGGFRSTVLGSVGLYCVLHAVAPVTIVRPTSSTASAAETAAGIAAARS